MCDPQWYPHGTGVKIHLRKTRVSCNYSNKAKPDKCLQFKELLISILFINNNYYEEIKII